MMSAFAAGAMPCREDTEEPMAHSRAAAADPLDESRAVVVVGGFRVRCDETRMGWECLLSAGVRVQWRRKDTRRRR
uniref:Uncharacterized protein n=1 Tax=Arundo donax TaxID=35708 RepID=A0A0A8YIA2_ARUDO